jgi:hypothetical protein
MSVIFFKTQYQYLTGNENVFFMMLSRGLAYSAHKRHARQMLFHNKPSFAFLMS